MEPCVSISRAGARWDERGCLLGRAGSAGAVLCREVMPVPPVCSWMLQLHPRLCLMEVMEKGALVPRVWLPFKPTVGKVKGCQT